MTRGQSDAVRARQRDLGVPESIGWVRQATPSLLDAVRSSGLTVAQWPLLVLSEPVVAPAGAFEVHLLRPDDELADVMAAVHAAFAGTDVVDPTPATRTPR